VSAPLFAERTRSWKYASIVKCGIIGKPYFSDCLRGNSVAPSALLQLPWELIFYSGKQPERKPQAGSVCCAPRRLRRQAFFALTAFHWNACSGRSSRRAFCWQDGGYIAAKTYTTSFCIRRKRKKGKNANEDFSVWEKTDADFGASAKDSAADHSHPQDLPRRYLGGRGKI